MRELRNNAVPDVRFSVQSTITTVEYVYPNAIPKNS